MRNDDTIGTAKSRICVGSRSKEYSSSLRHLLVWLFNVVELQGDH